MVFFFFFFNFWFLWFFVCFVFFFFFWKIRILWSFWCFNYSINIITCSFYKRFYRTVVFWRDSRPTGWLFEYSVFTYMLNTCGVFKMCFEFYASVKVICFSDLEQGLSFYLKFCIRPLWKFCWLNLFTSLDGSD